MAKEECKAAAAVKGTKGAPKKRKTTAQDRIRLVMLAQSVKSSMDRLIYIFNDYDMKDGEMFRICRELKKEADNAIKNR